MFFFFALLPNLCTCMPKNEKGRYNVLHDEHFELSEVHFPFSFAVEWLEMGDEFPADQNLYKTQV